MIKIISITFNILQFVFGIGTIIWWTIQLQLNTYSDPGIAGYAVVGVPFILAAAQFFYFFIIRLAFDDRWTKERMPARQYFALPENKFMLKSLGVGLLLALATPFALAIFQS